MTAPRRLPLLISCAGKVAFDTYALANDVVMRKKRAKNEQRRARQAYRCIGCGKWHLGNRPASAPRKTTRKPAEAA